MRQIQMGFFKNTGVSKSFGGELLKGRRKSKRPLSFKSPIHLVLRAIQSKIFRPGNQSLEKLIHRTAQQNGIQIYELAINWSHIHFAIMVRRRENYLRFIRVLTSKLAMAVAKTKMVSQAQTKEVSAPVAAPKLFTLRPFTRILSWGRDFKNALQYLKLNQQESRGEIIRRSKIQKAPKHSTPKSPRSCKCLQSPPL